MTDEQRPLRILFCTLGFPPGPSGGAEKQAGLQAVELARRGHLVTAVCPRRSSVSKENYEGVVVRRLWSVPGLWLWRLWRTPAGAPRRPLMGPMRVVLLTSYLLSLAVFMALRLRRFDLVHVHLAHLQADVAGLISWIHRKPLYITVECGGEFGEVRNLKKYAFVTRWFGLRHAARVQSLSSEIDAELQSISVDASRVVRIPNGLQLSRFHPSSADEARHLRAKLDLPLDSTLVLYAGRFSKVKGTEELLEAWRSVNADGAHLVLVGAPFGRPVVPAGYGENVTVRSMTDRVEDYMRAADIFVSPTISEGMSNAVLEAMACGLPIIAGRHGGTTDFLTDDDTLLIDPRNSEEIRSAIERLVLDQELRESYAAASLKVAERYPIASVVDQIEGEYRKIVKPR